MVHPSEIVYWELLPAIRKEMVNMMKEFGLKQSEIAKCLEVTPSAISQYLSNKRGSDFKFDNKFKTQINKSVKKILDDNSTAFKETNFLIKQFERGKGVCKICKDKNQFDGECRVCFK